MGPHAVDGASARRRTIVALVELAHFHFYACPHLLLLLHAADRSCKTVARACKPRFVSLGDWRTSKANRYRGTLRPVRDFSRNDNGTGVRLARHIHRHIEVNFLAPGQHRRRKGKRGGDGFGRWSVEQFGVELQGAEIETDAGHAAPFLRFLLRQSRIFTTVKGLARQLMREARALSFLASAGLFPGKPQEPRMQL